MQEYQLLGNINYQNKIVAIFQDKVGRKTFLEVDKKGEYQYLSVKDFLYLNNIYNNVNALVLDVPRYKFREMAVLSITGALILNIVVQNFNLESKAFRSYEASILGNSLTLSLEDEPKEYVYLDKIEDVEEFLNDDRDIKAILENNSDIPLEYKDYIYTFKDKLIEAYPEFDLRIFYHNLKTLKVVLMSEDELKKEHGSITHNVGGFYKANLNTIYIPYNCDLGTFMHELGHTTYHFYLEKDNKVYLRTVLKGRFLDEALNSEIANAIGDDQSYQMEKGLKDYLFKMAGLSIRDYNYNGVSYLIDALKKKYPDVDINYIIDVGDLGKDTLIKKGEHLSLDSFPYLLPELFKMCTKNIDKDKPFLVFEEFLDLFKYTEDKRKAFSYLEEFLEVLKVNNIPYNINMNIFNYRDIEGLLVSKYGVFPIDRKDNNYYIIKEDGGSTLVDLKDYKGVIYDFSDIESRFIKKGLDSGDSLDKKDFWQEFSLEYPDIKSYSYSKIPIYYNGGLLMEEFLGDLEIAITHGLEGYGFRITKGDQVIIDTNPEYKVVTNKIGLDRYVSFGNINDRLELKDVLNWDYVLSNKVGFKRYFKEVTPEIVLGL